MTLGSCFGTISIEGSMLLDDHSKISDTVPGFEGLKQLDGSGD